MFSKLALWFRLYIHPGYFWIPPATDEEMEEWYAQCREEMLQRDRELQEVEEEMLQWKREQEESDLRHQEFVEKRRYGDSCEPS